MRARVAAAASDRFSELLRWAWRSAFHAGAIRSGSRAARRFHSFGDKSLIGFPTAALMGEPYIAIGSRVIVGPYAALTAGIAPGQVPIENPTLRIGDGTVIGRAAAVAAHYLIEIGSDVWLAPHVFICDQAHDWTDLDTPIGQQLSEARAVRIGDGTWLGHGVIVLPGVTIGSHVAVGAGSVVTTDLPDRCVAVGSPARVVREHDPVHGWVRRQSAAARAAGRPA